MSKLAIQRENGTDFEWATTPPRLVDGECEWTRNRDEARDFSDVPPAVLAAWIPAIAGDSVMPLWFDNNPERPVDDREAKRSAALSALVVTRAKAGDAEALVAVEARAADGDAAAAAFVEERAAKARQAEAERQAAEEAARKKAAAEAKGKP